LVWIRLTQGRDKWRAVVNTVMKFRVSWNVGNSWLSEKMLLGSKELLS
jgi:hypothetical protein